MTKTVCDHCGNETTSDMPVERVQVRLGNYRPDPNRPDDFAYASLCPPCEDKFRRAVTSYVEEFIQVTELRVIKVGL